MSTFSLRCAHFLGALFNLFGITYFRASDTVTPDFPLLDRQLASSQALSVRETGSSTISTEQAFFLLRDREHGRAER
jgi:hypothetical protein